MSFTPAKNRGFVVLEHIPGSAEPGYCYADDRGMRLDAHIDNVTLAEARVQTRCLE